MRLAPAASSLWLQKIKRHFEIAQGVHHDALGRSGQHPPRPADKSAIFIIIIILSIIISSIGGSGSSINTSETQ